MDLEKEYFAVNFADVRFAHVTSSLFSYNKKI